MWKQGVYLKWIWGGWGGCYKCPAFRLLPLWVGNDRTTNYFYGSTPPSLPPISELLAALSRRSRSHWFILLWWSCWSRVSLLLMRGGSIPPVYYGIEVLTVYQTMSVSPSWSEEGCWWIQTSLWISNVLPEKNTIIKTQLKCFSPTLRTVSVNC